MTLDEKVGQLAQFNAGYATGPGASNLQNDELAAKGHAGSFLNLTSAEATNHYQHLAVEKTRLHIPILFGLDVIHGHRTTFPVPLALAASFDPAAVELVARYGATEARADGIPWVFSPMVDISPRLALGAHRRVGGRGSLPGIGDGPRVGEGLPAGRSIQA
jgi:beta-glucosidase